MWSGEINEWLEWAYTAVDDCSPLTTSRENVSHVCTVILTTLAVIPVILIGPGSTKDRGPHPAAQASEDGMAAYFFTRASSFYSLALTYHTHRRKEPYLHSIWKRGLGERWRATGNLITSEVLLLWEHFLCVLFLFCINVDTMKSNESLHFCKPQWIQSWNTVTFFL